MTSHREWFKDLIELNEPCMILIGDATLIEGIGIGNIELEAFDGKVWNQVVLENVLYTPKIYFNLFSVSRILDKGYVQSADTEKSIFKDKNGDTGAVALRVGNLFKMQFRQIHSQKCLVNLSIKKWHEKLAHQNVAQVRSVIKTVRTRSR